MSSSTSPTRTGPFTFLMRWRLSASLPEIRMTLTWVIPPLDPVLPSNWVTLAFTGSDSMVAANYYYIKYQLTIYLLKSDIFKQQDSYSQKEIRRIILFFWCFYSLAQYKLILLACMLANSYQHTFPGRINAKFIGAASRYSQQKQRRKTEEARKKSLESNYLYTQQKDRKLQLELSRLQSSRLRKLEQIKTKEELKQIKQYQLEKLRERNYKAREENRKRLEISRNRLLTMNQEGWSELKANQKYETQSLKKRIQSKLLAKTKQCLMIREQQLNGLKRIDSFHKRRNYENMQAYLKRIKQQSRLKRGEEAKARRLSKQIEKINKSVSLKTNYLNCIDEEINKYKTDIKDFNRNKMRQRQNESDQVNNDEKHLKDTFTSMYKQRLWQTIQKY